MNDADKKKLAESIEKRYGKRKNFKHLRNKAHREIYRKDILQPIQREFRDVYAKQAMIKQSIDKTAEEERIEKAKELDEIYRKGNKVLTIQQKVLKDIHKEHPTMVKEEDIIKWTQ